MDTTPGTHVPGHVIPGHVLNPFDARSYVVGLPVVITVHPDGRVEVDVDMSEASDIHEGVCEGQRDDAETLDRDVSAIDKAVKYGTYTVNQPTPED